MRIISLVENTGSEQSSAEGQNLTQEQFEIHNTAAIMMIGEHQSIISMQKVFPFSLTRRL